MNIIDSVAEKVNSGELKAETTSGPRQGWTAYQVARLLNEAVERLHLVDPKTGESHAAVPPQYVYNLAKNGSLDGNKGPVTGRTFTDEQVTRFVERWAAKRLPAKKAEEVDETADSE